MSGRPLWRALGGAWTVLCTTAQENNRAPKASMLVTKVCCWATGFFFPGFCLLCQPSGTEGVQIKVSSTPSQRAIKYQAPHILLASG